MESHQQPARGGGVCRPDQGHAVCERGNQVSLDASGHSNSLLSPRLSLVSLLGFLYGMRLRQVDILFRHLREPGVVAPQGIQLVLGQ
jgi:hypothetical protein